MHQFRVIPFGGCLLFNPLKNLSKRGLVSSVYDGARFRVDPEPYTLTEAIQLIGFLRGTLSIPRSIRRFCYGDADWEPRPGEPPLTDGADLLLLEPNSPFEIGYGPYWLNIARIFGNLVTSVRSLGQEAEKAVNAWYDGLQKNNDGKRAAAAEALLPLLPSETEDDEAVRAVVRDARVRLQDNADIVRLVRQVQDLLPLPTGLVSYTFRFLSDGRPFSWPPNFIEQITVAGRELNLPVFHPHEIVTRHGTAVALREDLRHYRDEFMPVIGDALLQFMHRVASRTTGSEATPPVRMPDAAVMDTA